FARLALDLSARLRALGGAHRDPVLAGDERRAAEQAGHRARHHGLRGGPDRRAHDLLPAHEHQVRERLEHDGADLHHRHGRDRALGFAVGDEPPQQQHDADPRDDRDEVSETETVASEATKTRGRTARPSLWFTVLSLAVFVLLIALGVWQVERRTWKLALIERVEQRVHADAQPIPSPASWPAVTAANDEYRHVTVSGR